MSRGRWSKDNVVNSIVIIGFGLMYLFRDYFMIIAILEIVVLILYYLFKSVIRDSIYKKSINFVDKRFVSGDNRLKNEHCVVTYNPNKSIVVMEISNSDKKIFTITNADLRVNVAWAKVCEFFDSNTTVQLLKEFFETETDVNVMTIEGPKEEVKKVVRPNGFVTMNNIHPDSFGVNPETNNANNDSDFIDLSNNSTSGSNNQAKLSNNQQTDDFINMDDIAEKFNRKIDINSAQATEISLLPGINIVAAKKILEYRNTKGEFKTIEDFLDVAQVKPHFVDKIKNMIVINDSDNNGLDKSSDDNGRIIDF